MDKKLLSHNDELGVTTIWHDDPDQPNDVVVEKVWDAEPALELAQCMRNETHGQKWGEMRHFGYVPPAIMGKMMRDGTWNPDGIKHFLATNPHYVTFDKYLKR